jgi:hypothetical protein
MFEGEIIFYNGFNLLVDVIIFVVTAWIFSRIYWRNGYHDGLSEGYGQATMDIDEGILYKAYCPEEKRETWSIKVPADATVHQLFSNKEAE